MEETGIRLKDQTDRCLKAYQAWNTSKKEPAALEEIQESLHELRKVLSRIEIEMATSERGELSQRPIPIPPHRASRNRGPNPEGGEDDFNTMDDAGDRQPNFNAPRPPQGGHQGGQGRSQHPHRRPMMRRPDNRE